MTLPADILKERKIGKYLNRKGEVLEINSLTKTNTTTLEDDHVVPLTITVHLKDSNNLKYYGCVSECNRNIDFTDYIQNVLPNEWSVGWPIESLKAGALAVKMYGWFAVYNPLATDVNAQVYDDTRSQVFIKGEEQPLTNFAISEMDAVALETYDTNQIFLAEYRAGTYDASGKGSGKVSQNGTWYWADQEKNYWFMLDYYYSYSTRLNGETLGYFIY